MSESESRLQMQGKRGNGKHGEGCLFVGENECPHANFRQQVGTLRQHPALHASRLALPMKWKIAQPCLHYLCTPKD